MAANESQLYVCRREPGSVRHARRGHAHHWQELDRRFDNFKGRVLVSCFSFDSDWETWEMHPAGDEIVCLLSGRVSFEFEGRGHVGELTKPGEFLIVPRGTWHPEQGDRLMALELRPTWEHCNKGLPPDSTEARICGGFKVKHRPVDLSEHARFAAKLKAVRPQER